MQRKPDAFRLSELAGKTLLIEPEQGLGDYIQFCRYALLARDAGARVLLDAPDPLCGLLSTLGDGIDVVASGQSPRAADFHIPVMSLPAAFQTSSASIPASVPYLFADPAKVAQWQQRLGPKCRPRVGLVWSGNRAHKNDHNRSLPARLLTPLFDLPIEFHCLQVEFRAEDQQLLAAGAPVVVHTKHLHDFSDTAALIEAMDVVVSVDTSVAHLAGAMGKRVWVLLPFVPDYRWMLDRADSPWYPSATLIRQPRQGEWGSVCLEVRERLAALAPALSLHREGQDSCGAIPSV